MSENRALIVPEDLEWTEIVPGIEFAVAHGEWSKEGHGKFIRFQPGAVAPMHTHSGDYHGVVLKGRFTNVYPDDENPVEMGPGSYYHVPAGAPHLNECVSDGECLLYTHSDGPWDIEMVEEG